MTALPFIATWRDAVLAVDESRLGWRAKLVAAALSTHARTDGTAMRPSRERLSEECSIAVRTVDRGLGDLLAAGFLQVERPGGGKAKPTVYRAVLPPLTLSVLHGYARQTPSLLRRIGVDTASEGRGNGAETLPPGPAYGVSGTPESERQRANISTARAANGAARQRETARADGAPTDDDLDAYRLDEPELPHDGQPAEDDFWRSTIP